MSASDLYDYLDIINWL